MRDYEKVACRLCDKLFYRITNTHLWRVHRMTIGAYREQFPDAAIEDSKLAHDRVEHLRGKTYEEVYGAEAAAELRASRSEAAIVQMSDDRQRALRSEMFSGREVSQETRQKQSVAMTEHGGFNYNKRALAFYGEQCTRCGAEQSADHPLVVHHKNMLHADGAGDHSIENLLVLCRSCHASLHRDVDGKMRGLGRFEKGILYVLEGMRRDFGIDMNDDNFVDTPKRFARAMSEILSGAFETEKQVASILSTAFDGSGFDEILVARGIDAVSLCPHHLLPVHYEIAVAYLPGNGRVLGLSKLVRLASVLAARPVLQERMTIDIARALVDQAGAQGAGVYVRGRHSCMWARGVRQNSEVITSAMLGVFRDSAPARAEVQALLGVEK